jgi:alpha-tubulin suppressor-like RCC1 family protein
MINPTTNQLTQIKRILHDIISVNSGYSHNVAITPLGVYAWGRNEFGQIGDNTTDRPIPVKILPFSANISIGLGGSHSYHDRFQFLYNGKIFCWTTWRRNNNRQIEFDSINNSFFN